jgi:hypothetical protein
MVGMTQLCAVRERSQKCQMTLFCDTPEHSKWSG